MFKVYHKEFIHSLMSRISDIYVGFGKDEVESKHKSYFDVFSVKFKRYFRLGVLAVLRAADKWLFSLGRKSTLIQR